MQAELHACGYTKVPNLLQGQLLERLQREVDLLEEKALQRCFTMPDYNTPRVMKVLGGQQILRESRLIGSLLGGFRAIVDAVVGRPLYPCLHPEECVVLNYLTEAGATHGWHLDDPDYALVVFLDTPELDGELEFIPHWQKLCQEWEIEPQMNVEEGVRRATASRLVRMARHRVGDAYVLHASTTLHRVCALRGPGRRVVLNVASESSPMPRYGHTASLLYGEGS